MSERQARILLLSRQSRGVQLRGSFLNQLAQALHSHVSAELLQGLPLTDNLRAVATHRYQAARLGEGISTLYDFECKDRALALRVGTALAIALGSEPTFLLTKQSEFCGAVALEASQV